MTAPRAVTVHTIDHGPVTVPEPPWCLGQHAEQHGGHRADIVHDGPETAAVFRGHELLSARLVAYPHAERLYRGPAVAVDICGEFTALDPAGLHELADALVTHAPRLRDLARQLTALGEVGEA